MNSTVKICQNCKDNFTIEPNDFGFYEKINVPPPTFCPSCRAQRRNSWRNSLSLYSRKCDLCSKSVVSIYSVDSGIIVYCNRCWWSDKWDPKSYGVDYDFSRPFFSQYIDLLKKVPHMAIVNDDNIASLNCEYTHDWWFSKNCYMCFSGWRIDTAMYSFFLVAGKEMFDCMNIMTECNSLYECAMVGRSYNLKYSFSCKACFDSSFLFDCKNCSDCFMSTGLVNKKYFYKNKEYSKEEYEKIIQDYRLDTWSGVERARKEYEEMILLQPRRFNVILNNQDCSGNMVFRSKNTKDAFVARKCENCRYGEYLTANKDCYDIAMSGETEECYEGVVVDHSQMNLFGIFSVKSQDVRYTQHCHSSKHLFGCAGLRNGAYCIFNKQYSKEDYEEMVSKIINQMNDLPYVDKNGNQYKYGEFYPTELSLFGYNETLAMENFPLDKNEISSKGYVFQENTQRTEGKETLKPEDIPESIKDVDDSVINEVLACVDCARNYKITQNELNIYKKMTIPIPRRCFYCRHNMRLKKRNPFKMWSRSCQCEKLNHHNHSDRCTEVFQTSYAPDRPEVVYCEKCYQQEVY